MSFLMGQTKELLPSDLQKYRQQLLDFIGNQGLGTALTGGNVKIDMSPYQQLFAQQRSESLASAKESAGNLTGSGFANTLGAAAGRSASQDNAFLGQLLFNAQQGAASRFAGLLGLPGGLAGQTAYQPGFLDYLIQGAGKAASIAGAGGGGGG